MAEVRDFYYGLPLFTRYWLGLTLITTFLTKLWWVDYNSLLLLNFDAVVTQGQIWRPITALFYYPFTRDSWFHFITNCWVMYCYSETLENIEFRGRPADYLTLLVFNWLCCVLIGFIINVKYLLDAMAMSVLNVWCQHNRHKAVVFRIGFEFQAQRFPWWLLLFNIIINQGGVMELIGIIVGHVAYFLAFQYPEKGGPALLRAPSILQQWFANARRFFNAAGSSGARPGPRPQASYSREDYHPWGRGYTCRPNPPRCATEARTN